MSDKVSSQKLDFGYLITPGFPGTLVRGKGEATKQALEARINLNSGSTQEPKKSTHQWVKPQARTPPAKKAELPGFPRPPH